MSNYPLRYKLTWLPRFLMPSIGDGSAFRGRSETLLANAGQMVRLVFIGDVSAVAGSKAPIVDQRLKDVIASADLVVANCESPIVDRPTFPISTALGIRHAMTADFFDAFLTAAGIDPKKLVVSLANNHVFDQGIEGFDATMATLAARGIRMIGTEPLPVFSVKGVRIAMPAFTEWRNESESLFSGRVVMADEIRPNDWRRAGADVICVVPHWGWEFRADPQPEVCALAAKFATAGVRIIAGHHAHIVQPVERIGAAVIAFGLGDFLGTAWPRVRKPLRKGAMLVVDVSADEATRGQLVRYQSIIFARERRRGLERLTQVE